MKCISFVFVVLLVFLQKDGTQGEGICDMCSCKPEDAPETVECKCTSPDMILEFEHQQMNSKLSQISNFTISDCNQAVIFNQGAFKELHQLENLEINNVEKVTFQPGVFQHLNHLKLRNIQDLDFKPSAFNGAQMQSVELYNSEIENLSKFSFYNIRALEKFVLNRVTIHGVETNAIMLKDNTAVEITNSTIENVAKGAIAIEAKSLVIFQSILKGLNDGAINLTAKSDLVISHTEFDENLPISPIYASAPAVNISNNHFNYLRKDILRNIKGDDSEGSIIFMNNTIEKFESDKPLKQPPTAWNIQGNEFQCSCEFLEMFKNINDSPLVKNNFCKSFCLLPLNKAAEKCSESSSTTLEEEVLCEGYTTPVRPLTTHRNREGRLLGSETPSNGTEKLTGNDSTKIVFTFEILLWSLLALKAFY